MTNFSFFNSSFSTNITSNCLTPENSELLLRNYAKYYLETTHILVLCLSIIVCSFWLFLYLFHRKMDKKLVKIYTDIFVFFTAIIFVFNILALVTRYLI